MACTHCADGLREPGHAHDDGETLPAEGGDSELVIDIAELRHGGEDAEVEQADVGGWAVVLPRPG